MPVRPTYAARHRARPRPGPLLPSRAPWPGAAALALVLAGAAVAPILDLPIPGPRTDAVSYLAAPTPARSGSGAATGVSAAAPVAELAPAAAARRAARALARARASRAAARARLAAAHRWVPPVATYRLSSPFGRRWGRLHAGDDLAAPTGTRVGALSGGTVLFAGRQRGYGNKVELRHWDGTESWYGHLSRIDVTAGQRVAPGARLGAVGSTGHSTGPHLHLEIHPHGGAAVDPRPWLGTRGVHV